MNETPERRDGSQGDRGTRRPGARLRVGDLPLPAGVRPTHAERADGMFGMVTAMVVE